MKQSLLTHGVTSSKARWCLLLALLCVVGFACTGGTESDSSEGARSAFATSITPMRAEDCDTIEPLPEWIRQDLTVGPGCVGIDRTHIQDDAVLTILPGTTVLMKREGYLRTDLTDGSAHLIAVGTAEQPIRFTSALADPKPGDWQCIMLTKGAEKSELRHVEIAFAGAPCEAYVSERSAALQVQTPAEAIEDIVVTDSNSHAVLLGERAGVRSFVRNRFARNAKASLLVHADQVKAIGEANAFEDGDDFIDIDVLNPPFVTSSGSWKKQSVPYRIRETMSVWREAELRIEAGATLAFDSAGIEVSGGNLVVDGTADEPVRFTSARPEPRPGDWSCVHAGGTGGKRIIGTPMVRHAVFEYGGQDCMGTAQEAVLLLSKKGVLKNTTFQHLKGAAVAVDRCQGVDWCMKNNTFEASVQGDDIECVLPVDDVNALSCP